MRKVVLIGVLAGVLTSPAFGQNAGEYLAQRYGSGIPSYSAKQVCGEYQNPDAFRICVVDEQLNLDWLREAWPVVLDITHTNCLQSTRKIVTERGGNGLRNYYSYLKMCVKSRWYIDQARHGPTELR